MRVSQTDNPQAYWWKGNGPHNPIPNFGDALAPLLLSAFSDLTVDWSPISHASIVTVGSVLEHVPPLWDGYIVGAGKLYEDSRLQLHTNTATILALRGPLSARQCPPGDYALGDPGLLAERLFTQDPPKTHDLGIVPHWSDKVLAKRDEFYSTKWTTQVISPADDPLTVITKIASCWKIVTSSLHGMIIADAFDIPRRFEFAKSMTAEGMFKFRDYSASIMREFEPGKLIQAKRLRVLDRQYELYDAFYDLGQMVRRNGN